MIRRPFGTLLLGALLVTHGTAAQPDPSERAPDPPPEEPEASIDASQLSKLPKQIGFAEAEYPSAAEERGVETEVVLLLDIDERGDVIGVGIAEPVEPPDLGFEEAAILAAQRFKFEPAELNGKPVAIQITYRYKFKLKPKREEAAPPPAAPAVPAPAEDASAGSPKQTPPQVNFRGTLIERGTRLPVAGAVITLFQEGPTGPVGFEATTDEAGAFEFRDLAPGEWKVLADPPGYYPFRTTEAVQRGELVEATFHIERGTYNPFDVTVTSTKPRKEVSRTILSAEEIDKVPGTAGDPLAVIQNLPGVARVDNPAQLIVRGSAPEDSRVFIDGVEVPLIYHFGGLRSVIPVGVLDSIEFYPGNFSPQYGRATGGIVDVRIKQLNPQKIGGYADVSILDTGVFLEVPFGEKGGVAIAGRRSYIDFILNAAVPDDAGLNLVTAPRFYDGQLVLNYRPTPEHDLRAFVLGSDDRLEVLFENPEELDPELGGNRFSASTSFYRSILSYRYVPSPEFENTLRLSQGRNWIDFEAGALLASFDLYTTQVRDSARLRIDQHLSLHAGADILFTRADLTLVAPRFGGEGDPEQDFDLSNLVETRVRGRATWSPAVFAEVELEPGAGFLFIPGVRVDSFGGIDAVSVQPRLTGRWTASESLTLKGGLGVFSQEPQFLEIDQSFGNPDLGPERAIHYSAGAEYALLPHLTLDATLFYKKLSNLVGATDRVVADGSGTRPLLYDNNSSGHVRGLELVARHELYEGLSGWVAYTLSRSMRLDSGATEERLFDFDQTHILTLVASYALPRNWQLGTRWRLVTGNPITPVVGAVYDASADEYSPTYGAVNSARNGPFHQLDLRIDKRWVYEAWMLTAYLDLQNLYNRQNPEGLGYNYDFRRSQVQQGLPLVPIIGVRGEF